MFIMDILLVIYVYTIYNYIKLICTYIFSFLSTQYILHEQNINFCMNPDKKDNAICKHIVKENIGNIFNELSILINFHNCINHI